MAHAAISFKDACEIVRSGEAGPELLEKTQLATQALLLFAPIVAGIPFTAVAPGLGLLGLTGELTSIGKEALKWATKEKDKDLLSRERRMSAAHSLLTPRRFRSSKAN